ncbi:TetR/AcrR family transcriptional regulator [Mycolicibacterium sp. P1-5]|uniref:TetR/AcrR family transcriptional regulator n=1 Tax=Mycolicibacterium sp. P1-5 TaxID=2024617 RepID=UPI0018833672|nr:TetR/AcrR family transcriptional regulator [Mycolicibacterium sp. P1-5]
MTSDERAGRLRRSTRRDLVEKEILAHASALFAEKGYAGTTPQQIADSVGMSRQSLYYYMSSKEDILAKLVAHMTTSVVERMREVVSDTALTPTEKLSGAVKVIVTDRATRPLEFRLLDRSASSLPEALTKEYLDGRRQALAIMQSVIAKGNAAGEFRAVDERVAALSILGMCNWVAWWFEPGDDHPVQPVAEQIAANAVAMLVKPGSTAGTNNPLDLLDQLQHDVAALRDVLSER